MSWKSSTGSGSKKRKYVSMISNVAVSSNKVRPEDWPLDLSTGRTPVTVQTDLVK